MPNTHCYFQAEVQKCHTPNENVTKNTTAYRKERSHMMSMVGRTHIADPDEDPFQALKIQVKKDISKLVSINSKATVTFVEKYLNTNENKNF